MKWINRYRDDFRQNLKLAYPIMLGQIGQIMVNIIDNLMVGRLGAESLAAISIANSIIIAFIVIGMGISFALPPLISEADGAGDHRSVSQNFKHSLVVNMTFSIIALCTIWFGIPLLQYAGQDPGALALAIPYLKVSAWMMIPIMLFLTLRAYCEGLSKTKLPMYAIIVGNVINVIFNYLLIFGKFGFPVLGVVGAVTSSMIARVCMILILGVFILRSDLLRGFIREANFRVYQKALFIKNLSLGIPTSLQLFFEVSAFSGAALIMGMVGKTEQAAHQISINLASITFLICSGIGMAATIRVGNQLGKRDYQKLQDAGRSALLQVVLFMGLAAMVFVFGRYLLPSVYISDPEVISVAATLLIWAAVFQLPDGIQVIALGALRGLQDVKIPTLITFLSYWIFGIPASYYLALHTSVGPAGVWIGLVIGLSVSAGLLTLRFLKFEPDERFA